MAAGVMAAPAMAAPAAFAVSGLLCAWAPPYPPPLGTGPVRGSPCLSAPARVAGGQGPARGPARGLPHGPARAQSVPRLSVGWVPP